MAADWLVPQCSAMKNEEHEKKCLEHAGAARGEHTMGTAYVSYHTWWNSRLGPPCTRQGGGELLPLENGLL